MQLIEWKNEKRRVCDLIPWDKNPRKISDEQLEQLKRSIEKFNYAAPILIDADGRIVAGHMRCKALMALGRGDELLDIRVASRKLTEQEFCELAIRDNANGGDWDIDRLLEMDLKFLKDIGLDERTLNTVSRKSRIDQAEEVPDPPLHPKTKLGDLFRLGDHLLLCGDSTKRESFERLMKDEPHADMVLVDPPYNVNYSGTGKNTSNTIENDNQSEADFRMFLQKAFIELYEFTTEKAAMYCCYASRTHREFEDALNAAGWNVRSQIIWIKTVASMGWSNYRWKHEPIFYCAKEGGVNFYGDRTNYTEWREELTDEQLLARFKSILEKEETEGDTTIWRVKREVDYKHPTQKPVQLCRIAIANSTTPGQVVLDTFAGSGSTLMACELTRRHARVIELDPKYCDVIIERWEAFTNKKAEKI